MPKLTFGGGLTALRFGAQHLHHLHLTDSDPDPHRSTLGRRPVPRPPP